MNLYSILDRQPDPTPWSEGEKIPWDDPGFSARMLHEHLSQDHDLASRRTEKIDQHVHWIHSTLLSAAPARILDLGCGPGLYLHRLAELGHDGTGIDFSPASVEYARKSAETAGLSCTYIQKDIRHAEFGSGYNLVMFIFGELNAFKPVDAQSILNKAFHALQPGGTLLLEVSTFESLERCLQPATWFSSHSGLFSDRPHICLSESFWNAEAAAVTERYFVIDVETCLVTRMAASTKAYTEGEYRQMAEKAGFTGIKFHPSLTGEPDPSQQDFFAITGRKP